jgi:hypothetical protein
LTPNIHSSHDLHRPEAKRFRVKLTNLNIPKTDLVDIFIGLLEAEKLKSKNLAHEYPALVPAYVAAVVHSMSPLLFTLRSESGSTFPLCSGEESFFADPAGESSGAASIERLILR